MLYPVLVKEDEVSEKVEVETPVSEEFEAMLREFAKEPLVEVRPANPPEPAALA